MRQFRPSAAFLGGGLALGLILAAGPARAHDTLSFDPNAPPEFPMKPGMAAPPVIQGMAIARLRPQDLEIDLTVADSAAYKLLDPDPYQPPTGTGAPVAVADNSSGLPRVHDPHFERDKPLLAKRGESLFIVTNNGQALNPLAVAVDFTESQDVVFHITYPRVAAGTLRLFITYFNQVPAGQKDIVTINDSDDRPLATSTNVGATAPYLDVEVPGAPVKAAAAAGISAGKVLAAAAGLAAGGAALIFLLKRLHRPERG